MGNRILFAFFAMFITLPAWASVPNINNNPAIPLLRLKMVLDSFNYDDIAIGFLASATTAYNNQIDSRYLPGIDAPEGFSSYSSDNVPLSVNVIPLPGNTPLVIRLDVEAQNSGPFTIQRTELDSIPQVYDIWLMDKYAKDSLNLRNNTSYAFNINKSDTATFGGNRFAIVIRQKPALPARLLSFDASKTGTGNQLEWTTENEQSTTSFSVERSIDAGQTFISIDSVESNGLGTYSYTDKNPLAGANVYRLKMTDITGVITFSDIVTVDDQTQAVKKDNAVSIYPNPSNGPINLTISPQTANASAANTNTLQVSTLNSRAAATGPQAASFAIKIVNINGVVVRSATISAPTWQDNLAALTPGTYFIQVVNNTDNKIIGKSTFIKL